MEGFKTILAFGSPGGWEFILIIFFIVSLILLTRLFGAWMLRINEVIDLLREIKELLKKP